MIPLRKKHPEIKLPQIKLPYEKYEYGHLGS